MGKFPGQSTRSPGIYLLLICFSGFLISGFTSVVLHAQQEKSDPESTQSSDTTKAELTAKLKTAVDLGEIRIGLLPMIPSENVRGLRWSPKGSPVELEKKGGVLAGQLTIGDHSPVDLEFSVDDSTEPGEAVLKLDIDQDGEFGDDEVERITGSDSRGKTWYSSTATIRLPTDEASTRAYPVALWYVVEPEQENEDSKDIIRWSRRGWHEGTFEINGKECVAVISDSDADGMFANGDAWGLGETAEDAYSHENSTNPLDGHAWLDSVAFRITRSDEEGRFITIRAFDLGMTQAEDRERKDPYAADRKYARSQEPVQFLGDFEEAMERARSEDKRVVVDFVTTWCGPCKVMDQLVYTARPVVEKSSGFVFVKLDGDEQKELKEKFGVEAFPTLILLDPDGAVVRKVVGYQGVVELLELLN